MTDQEKRWEQLAKTNPLFGKRRLKLGTFCTNVSGGATMSSASGVLEATWGNAALLAQLANEMDFEAIVPIGRWRGFGGATDFNGESFESMTFAAALSAVTPKPSVFATIHVPSIHPVMAAKQATTIDHVSQGRFTINIVTGWNRNEIELFGSPIMEHDTRYDAADEWISLMKLTWTSDEPVDFDGRFYKVKQAHLRPRPIQPYPTLMSAGASAKGQAFAAKHCDIAFTSFTNRDPASMRSRLNGYRELARERHGRDIKIWINAYVFMGDTLAEAQQLFDYCILEKGDWVGADNMLKEIGIGNQSHPPEMLQKLKEDFMAGWAGFRLLGTKEKIVDDIKMLVDVGVDGILLSWPRFVSDMQQFQRDVYPLLVQEGLR